MLNEPFRNSDAGSVDAEVKALRTLVMFLLDQLRDLHARCEAQRVLMEQRGVFSRSEYDQMHAEAVRQWNQAVGEHMSQAIQDANAEALKRLLENFQGPKQ